jgi:hypothetical protein
MSKYCQLPEAAMGHAYFNANELRPERIARGDPILRLLSRVNVSPILVGSVYSAIFTLVRALVAWRAGHLHTVGTVIGFLDDPGPYTGLISAAVIWAYYTWMPRGIVALFKGLYSNGVIGDPVPTMQRERKRADTLFIETMQASLGKWWWSALSLVTAAGVASFILLPRYLTWSHSTVADTLSLILSLLWTSISIYCVTLLLVFSVLTIYWLNRLFRSFVIHVRPLHPDRAGGLSSLGNFTLVLSYIVALVGIILVITPMTRNYLETGRLQYQWTTDILAGLALYVVTAPVVFFAPLSVAHITMKEAKDELLLQISLRFEVEYVSVRQSLYKDVSGLEDRLKTLEELQSLYEMTDEFPVWPFNVASVSRFSTSFLSPIALAVLVDLLGRFITP